MRTAAPLLTTANWLQRGLGTALKWDTALCRRLSRLQRWRALTLLLRAVSRLGNGMFWYGLMLALPLVYGLQGLQISLHMGIVGLVCLLVYRWLKRRTARPRPADTLHDVQPAAAILDEFSFPSGHTLHAVAFTLIAGAYLPELLFGLVPLVLLIALSRPALGLHYPGDVLAGAALGGGIAGIGLLF